MSQSLSKLYTHIVFHTKHNQDLIKANVNVLKDKKVETFRNFTKFFETIVAYYYGYGGK
jgi:CRISPR/Cas system CSM-associated protein Csm2 small subunit